MVVATTAPCGLCGTPTDLELHGHWTCFPCMRDWSRWLELHPREAPLVPGHRAGHQHESWVAAYERFLAEGRIA